MALDFGAGCVGGKTKSYVLNSLVGAGTKNDF